MDFIFAEAGLGEAAEFFALVIIAGIFLGTIGLLVASWWKRSLIITTIACIVILAVGALLHPWSFFAPAASIDPDENFWLFWERVVLIIWLLLTFASITCLIRVIRHRKLH